MYFFGATGTPVLDFWVSKRESVLSYSLLVYRGKCNVHSPRSTSDATCANLLEADSTAGHFLTSISRGGTWFGFEWAITRDRRRMRYHLCQLADLNILLWCLTWCDSICLAAIYIHLGSGFTRRFSNSSSFQRRKGSCQYCNNEHSNKHLC